jgi:hypothetical protein
MELPLMPGIIFSKIISGGQTGVDRAALDVALEFGIPCGGWCTKGRRAEDGPIDLKYPLKETKSAKYQFRTEANVMEADGTLILTSGIPTGGTAFTIEVALKHKKPYLVIDLNRKPNPSLVRDWGNMLKIGILNVAGPRESKIPGIYGMGKNFLESILAALPINDRKR